MPNTTSYEFGDMVLVAFPFTNQQGSKQRPAVVISSQAYNQNKPDVILMAITSQVKAKFTFAEKLIGNWQPGMDAQPIDLIDSEILCDKLKKLRLGVETKLIESVEIKNEWFNRL